MADSDPPGPAANIGLEHGLIGRPLFAALVLLAIVTTASTWPLASVVLRGIEVEHPFPPRIP